MVIGKARTFTLTTWSNEGRREIVAMKYRKLGTTGLEVSEIGFGAWGIGGSVNGDIAYGPTDDRESKLTIRRAFEMGVTFYDTSDFYGFGRSEQLIGKALKDFREQIIIATKVGLLSADGEQDFSAKHIRSALEKSLIRLKTDYIDLYQLHSPPIDMFEKDDRILLLLDSLKKEGKIRAFGISVRSPDDGLIAIKKYGFKVLQVNFNMTDQRAIDNGLFALCEKQGVGIINRTPLCFGFLTGKYSGSEDFHSFDHRAKWAPEQIKQWAGAYKLFSDVPKKNEKQSQAQIALRYCLSYPCISTVIPGMLTRQHVEENILASEFGPVSRERRLMFEAICRNNTFFTK
jgi:aryl-alcohol dehydrogenase-like predicted oxidoreductase